MKFCLLWKIEQMGSVLIHNHVENWEVTEVIYLFKGRKTSIIDLCYSYTILVTVIWRERERERERERARERGRKSERERKTERQKERKRNR